MHKGKFRFMAGLLLGALLGGAAMTNVGAQVEELEPKQVDDEATGDFTVPAVIEPKRLYHYLVAVENSLVSLAVDTEKSAIGIADLDSRIRKIERRLVNLEKRAPDKPRRDR